VQPCTPAGPPVIVSTGGLCMKSPFRFILILLVVSSCVSPPPASPPPEKTPVVTPIVVITPEKPLPPVVTPETDILTIGDQLRIFQETGDAAKARIAVETQIGLARLTTTDKSAYAGLLLAEGRLIQAKNEFEEVLKAKPDDKDSLISLASLSAGEGDTTKQQIYLDRLLKAYPADPQALAAMGLFHYSQDRTDRALKYFNQSLGAQDNPDAREGLARISLDEKKWEEALVQLEAGLALDPTRDTLFSLKSRAHSGLKQYLESEVDLTSAIKVSPENLWNLLDRARLRWRDLYKPEGSLEDLEKVLSLEPDNFFALVYRGEINESKDHVKAAYQDYLQVLKIRPDYKYAYPSMSILAFQSQDWERAQTYALKAWTLYSGEYAFPWIAALSLRMLNRPNDAKSILDQAYRQYGNQPLIQEMCRFLLTPTVAFGLDDGLAKEKSPVVKARLKFYQGFQYHIMKMPQASKALWDEVSQQVLRNVPEVRMAKAFLTELP